MFALRFAFAFVAILCAGATRSEEVVVGKFFNRYCIECHRDTEPSAGISLLEIAEERGQGDAPFREKILKQLQTRQMPPVDSERPSESEYREVVNALTNALDRAYFASPSIPKSEPLRRLTRTEYRNAIRDLFGFTIDEKAWLPADDSSHGFDNVTVGELTPTQLQRYVASAEKIAKLVVGSVGQGAFIETIRMPADVTQESHVEGLPLGTRGGTMKELFFPVDGDYEFEFRLTRDRNEHVEGLNRPHDLEFFVDGETRASFQLRPPKAAEHQTVDADLKARIRLAAGKHRIGAAFVKQAEFLLETLRQPYQARYNMHRHPRTSPALYQISIVGPFKSESDEPRGSKSDKATGSKRDAEASDESLAERTMRLAFRRAITAEDRASYNKVYHGSLANGESEQAARELGLASILVNPHFLFRTETTGEDQAGSIDRLSDESLASRLSFFLWSSLPDQELLEQVDRRRLAAPEVLGEQVTRMLRDNRSQSLVANFADQWLYLRNLDNLLPDLRLFPDFDDNLRQAFRRETELCFTEIVRDDRSLLDLIRRRDTFVNERLAKHYGLKHIYGDHFRKVEPDVSDHRGGLLRHGSILTVTSYADRTSPVLRGHWVLKNLMGMAPPPPPANVPALKEATISNELSVRDRLAEHRAAPACASCHQLMDPLGLTLENYDAIGRWRELEAGKPIDASAEIPDGSKLDGVAALEAYLLERPEQFVSTFVEKLMTYALGRGIESHERPAIRKIVRDAARDEYRLSSLVHGVVQSIPFTHRSSR